MAKVKFSFGSISNFEKLKKKDCHTIYVVNETGDFSSSSLDDDGDVYLGDKLLTGGGGGGQVPALSSTGGVIAANSLYLLGQLSGDVSLTLDSNFDTAVANEWHVIFHTGATPYNVTVSAPAADANNTYSIKGSMPVIQSNKTYEVSILYAGASDSSAQSGGNRGSGSHVFLLTCKAY